MVLRLFPALFLLIGWYSSLQAQAPGNISARTTLDTRYWPFYHGVASGDPLTDRVIIWTRVTPNDRDIPVSVDWVMATDTALTNVVRMGTFVTDSSRDFTVKIDVDSLQADSWYYYRFETNGRYSLTGRTRTAPSGSVDSVRFAIVSCSDYVDGYFHAYERIVERNDIDAVLHLGDYIYENGSEGTIGRPHEPNERITELNDYRQRYSQYRLDENLRCIHQMYPFITVWDDHESANNAWMGGAEAHDFPADGLWEHRKKMAVQAYYEWLPIRPADVNDSLRIYRKFEWGDIVDFFMLDTRLIGRDSQVTGTPAIDDPNRNLIGPDQLGWLSNEMRNSAAQWRVVGQQVMMAPLEAPFVGPLNNDDWNGYRAERQRFYDTVLTHNVENVVVLTGDIHSAWASNLESGGDRVGVEFVATSVTTMNSPFAVPQAIIQAANPHIKYINLDDHGYYILDLNKTRCEADYYFVGDIENPVDSSQSSGPYWYTLDSARVLQESSTAATPRSDFPVVQPTCFPPNPVSVTGPESEMAVIGTYPNPFWDAFLVKFYLFEPETVSLQLYDLTGRQVRSEAPRRYEKGLHYIDVEGASLPSGVYIMRLSTESATFERRVVRF